MFILKGKQVIDPDNLPKNRNSMQKTFMSIRNVYHKDIFTNFQHYRFFLASPTYLCDYIEEEEEDNNNNKKVKVFFSRREGRTTIFPSFTE